MGYSLVGSLFIVQYTKVETLEQAFEQILADEHGYYHHPFIIVNPGQSNLCEVCKGTKAKHITGQDDMVEGQVQSLTLQIRKRTAKDYIPSKKSKKK